MTNKPLVPASPQGRRSAPRRARGLVRATTCAGTLGALLAAGPGTPLSAATSDAITVVSTTSTENSGLLDVLLPAFTADTGIRVRLISVGTGQALRIGRNGDADALVVHHPASERAFVAAGHGLERRPVMWNDFVLVGPAADPAGVRGSADAASALARVAAAAAPFVSRGDESGTHAKERELWAAAGVDPATGGRGWYRETGAGQGASLNIASAMAAYALTDRATWLRFGNKGPLELLVAGDPRLDNPYSAILVNPARHPHVRAAAARRFVDWLTGETGQTLIAGYRIDGEAGFHPARAVDDASSGAAATGDAGATGTVPTTRRLRAAP
jgi:tungstate transport system substrate-binding protein